MSHLVISLLGTFQITHGSTSITEFESNKVRALLAYLAVEVDRPHTREALSALLWPESAQETALNSLRNALANLRRAIGDREANPPYLLITRRTVQFNHSSDSCLDIADVIHEAASLQQPSDNCSQSHIQTCIATVKCYRGPFLEGFSIPDSAAFEKWVSLWRERLQQWTLEGLRWLADYYEARGDYAAALEFARRQVALDAWFEEGHCQIMRLLALNGQREQALRQYHSVREILSKDLEAEPSESTTQLYKDILSGCFSTVPPKAHSHHNLPLHVTSFIGREKEIETLKRLILSGQTRLVTVTGAGGTGKTRLALRVAEELLESFPAGIWLVELAAVADPVLVPAVVASAVGLREGPKKPILEILVDFLRSKHILILLDNCEHLVDAVASLVDRILHTSARVTILTTSREILRVSGEMPFLCPSLALPEPHSLQLRTNIEQITALVSCEAVRLFTERSAQASSAFVITEKNAPIVAQVCHRLDGIPLAIELAAARMRVLSIEQIAERLDHAFLLLTGGSRTAMPRQQTLKATIDWSYNLLSPAERMLLLRLSIFSGGWTLGAAEAVCSENGTNSDSLLPERVLDLLSRLVDKSLILVEPRDHGEPRYRMLDTVCQYAHNRLLEAGGDSLVRDRHLIYFLQLAEQAEVHLRANGMVDWLNQLDLELGNLRIALEWSQSVSVEQGLRLATALLMFWHIRSRRFEGIKWLEWLIEANKAGERIQLGIASRRIVLGKALIAAGFLNHLYPGSYSEHARLQLKEAMTIFHELGNLGQKFLPSAMYYLSSTEDEVRDCLALAREVGDEFHAAESLGSLKSYMIIKGDLKQAMSYAQENLAIRKKIGDIDGEASALYGMANVELMQGNLNRAIELWKASQRCFQTVENFEFALIYSGFQAEVALTQGDYLQALQLSKAQLAAGQECGSSMAIATALGFLVWADWALKEYDQAARRCEEVLGPDWENNLPCGRGTLFYVFGRIALSRGEYARSNVYLKHFATMVIPEKFLSIQALGILAAAKGQTKRAVVLFGALDGLCIWLKNVTSPAERSEYEQALESTRSTLGNEAFQSAWVEGQSMTLDQMLTFVAESMDLD